ncbi:hypothetical protein FJY70_03655 [candidate division WOR-3 bacterium]|nr:hypothetical protein [candidate division WOR-3 bacterium]
MNTRLRQCLYGGLMLGGLLAAAESVYAQFVEDSVRLTQKGATGLAYNSRHGVVYCVVENRVLPVDCQRLMLIGGCGAPDARDVAYSVTQDKGYCTFGGNSLMVIEGWNHQPMRVLAVPAAQRLLWDPDVDRLYVSCPDANKVAVVDCRNDSVIASIRVGAWPRDLALNRPHRKLYVLNLDGESLSIIDLNTNRVIRTIRLGNVPYAGYYLESAAKYYCGASHIVWVVDGIGDTVTSAVTLHVSAEAMTGNEELKLLLVGGCTAGGCSVYTISAIGDSVIHAVPVRGLPCRLVRSAASGLVYCAEYSNSVSVLAGDGSRVDTTLRVGSDSYPFVMIAVPEFRRVFVGCLESIWMYVIRDTGTGIGEESPEPSLARRGCVATPNPFKNSLALRCDPVSGRAGRMTILSLLGAPVRTLSVAAGAGRVDWDGRDKGGKEVSPGVYVAVPSWRPAERVRIVKAE